MLRALVREALVYDETGAAKFGGEPPSEWEPEAVLGAWKKHLQNRYYLSFMLANGTAEEKGMASHELDVCDRKLEYWERHPKFDRTSAGAVNREVASEWASRAVPAYTIGSLGSSRPRSLPARPGLGVSPTAKAAPGSAGAERVTHTRFGPGTVVRDLGDGKVQVVFDTPRGSPARTLDRSFLRSGG